MAAPSLPTASDPELVAAWQRGDERAATELVRRHAPALARFLYSGGSATEDLDDLVQETFLRAFRRLATWRGETAFHSWLFAIAANLRKDLWRRRRGPVVLPLEGHDAPGLATPDREFEADETEERLRQALATLPRLQREVFLRRVQLGEDYAAIAVALGTTPGAARVHYHHAVQRLKESLR